MQTVTVIVPAFNEADCIPQVLQSLAQAKQDGIIHDVLVVDDGSTDQTAALARRFGARVLQLPKNHGKAFAVFAGVQHLSPKPPAFVLTLDADLKAFSPAELNKLIQPLKENPQLHMTVGHVETAPIGFSGQRGFQFKPLWQLSQNNSKLGMVGLQFQNGQLHVIEEAGFGIEKFLNEHFKCTKTKVQTKFDTIRLARDHDRITRELTFFRRKFVERNQTVQKIKQLRRKNWPNSAIRQELNRHQKQAKPIK